MGLHGPGSVLPEILEPIRRHFGVANRVHDIFMAHIVLEGSGVMPIVGELVTSGVPEHAITRSHRSLRALIPDNRARRPGDTTFPCPLGTLLVSPQSDRHLPNCRLRPVDVFSLLLPQLLRVLC
jgi:hypothetical protein